MKKLFFIFLLLPFMGISQSLWRGGQTVSFYTTTQRDAKTWRDSSMIYNIDSFTLQVKVSGGWHNVGTPGTGAAVFTYNNTVTNNGGNIQLVHDSTITAGNYSYGVLNGRLQFFPTPAALSGLVPGYLPVNATSNTLGSSSIFYDGTITSVTGGGYTSYWNKSGITFMRGAIVVAADSPSTSSFIVGGTSALNSGKLTVVGATTLSGAVWVGGTTAGKFTLAGNDMYYDNLISTGGLNFRTSAQANMALKLLGSGGVQMPLVGSATLTLLDTTLYSNAAIKKSDGTLVGMNWQVPSGSSDSGFAVLKGNLGTVPIAKAVVGSARFILFDTLANNPGGIVTQASRQKLADSLINLINVAGSGERVMYTQIGTVNVSNTTVENSMIVGGSNPGTPTFAANALTAGKMYRIRVSGVYSATTVPGNLTIRIKLGTSVITGVITNLIGGTTNAPFTITGTFTVTTAVSNTSTVVTDCMMAYQGTALSARNSLDLSNGATGITATTNTTNTVDATFQFATANTNNAIKTSVVQIEVLN